MRHGELHIVGMGAMTPAGACAAVSCASVAAGLGRATLHERADGSSCHVAFVSALEPGSSRIARMRELLQGALQECAESLPRAYEVPVWLAVPADATGRQLLAPEARFGRLICSTLQEVAEGNASGILAIERVAQLLAEGQLELACVAGVDVKTDEETLEALAARRLLLSEDRPWGFVPSEGAGALLLASERMCRVLGLSRLGRVLAVASQTETATQRGLPIIGRALSRACHTVLDQLPKGLLVGDIYCDLNGERSRADDWGYTAPRIAAACRDASEASAPALQWGDLGHATGPLLVEVALTAFLGGGAQGQHALVWCASEEGMRGALLLAPSDATAEALHMPDATRPRAHSAQDTELLEELLADACFLFEQRMRRRDELELTPEQGSAALEASERRLEAHVDGLALAGDATLALCDIAVEARPPGEQNDEGVPGLTYVALRLWLRKRQTGRLSSYLSSLDLARPELFRAARAALCHGAGPIARQTSELLLAHEAPLVRALGLWLSGDTGSAPSIPWAQLGRDGPAQLGASFPWALGRLGSPRDAYLLNPWLREDDPERRRAGWLGYLGMDPARARHDMWSWSMLAILPTRGAVKASALGGGGPMRSKTRAAMRTGYHVGPEASTAFVQGHRPR